MTTSFRQQVMRFLGVGGVGFIVDAGLLGGLIFAGANPFIARLLSFPIAVLVTWWLHRNWTFATATRTAPIGQISRYFWVQLTGAAINYAIYAMVLLYIDQTPKNAVLALAAGSFFGLFVNFMGSKYIAFSHTE